jgi:hypothetical protein
LKKLQFLQIDSMLAEATAGKPGRAAYGLLKKFRIRLAQGFAAETNGFKRYNIV